MIKAPTFALYRPPQLRQMVVANGGLGKRIKRGEKLSGETVSLHVPLTQSL